MNILLGELAYRMNIFSFLRSDIRKARFPKVVVIQTINRCNSACSMCPYVYTVAKEKETIMDESLYRKILNEISQYLEFETLFFTFQNEPLLDKRIFDWAKMFKQKLPKKRLELVTNGSLLTPDVAKEIYEYFDMVHVSLNALSPKTHKIVSNTDQYNQIFDNLISISKNPQQQKKTIVRFVRQKANYFERKDFFRFWRKMGFMVFGFDANDRLKDVKNFKEKINVPYSLFDRFKLKINKYLGKILLPTCPMPFLAIYIKANGDVIQCFSDWSNNHILANVKNQSIGDIFNHNEKYVEVRKKLLDDHLDENVICSKCDLYKESVWLSS